MARQCKKKPSFDIRYLPIWYILKFYLPSQLAIFRILRRHQTFCKFCTLHWRNQLSSNYLARTFYCTNVPKIIDKMGSSWASVILQDPREPRKKKSNLLRRPRRGANLETIKLSGCRFTALGCHDRSFRIPANLGSNRTYYGGRGVVCGYQAR